MNLIYNIVVGNERSRSGLEFRRKLQEVPLRKE